jgi:hypothetical protein
MPQINQRYQCRWDGTCRQDATCVGRLYVPAHPLSRNRDAKPITAMLGLPLCDTHFALLDVRKVLGGERGQAIRESVEAEFKRRGAMPDFDKASIGRINQTDHDFGRFEILQERARAS